MYTYVGLGVKGGFLRLSSPTPTPPDPGPGVLPLCPENPVHIDPCSHVLLGSPLDGKPMLKPRGTWPSHYHVPTWHAAQGLAHCTTRTVAELGRERQSGCTSPRGQRRPCMRQDTVTEDISQAVRLGPHLTTASGWKIEGKRCSRGR